jgi:hypothetical protein
MRLYHATYADNVPSILRDGLLPDKTHNWSGYYLEGQVFLAFNPETAEDFLSESETYDGQKIAIIEVNADALDLDRFAYDWNNRCVEERDITSVAYEGKILPTALRLLPESERLAVPLTEFGDLKHGDERATRIFWILADVFDEEVEKE